MKTRIFITITLFFILSFMPLRSETVRDIIFPLEGSGYILEDSFGDPRWGNDDHEGIDIMADKMTPILSATDGVVSFIADPEKDWGYAIFIKDSDGYRYWYLHINNDTPGTDDNNGGTKYAYAPGIKRGVSVQAGQHIGYVGDSGNAENSGSHLHFEIHLPNNTPVNPYHSLLQAIYPGSFAPETETISVSTISENQNIQTTSNLACEPNSLIKADDSKAVYYCGLDGKRYVFANLNTYLTWYDDFEDIKTITRSELGIIPLGGVVTYKPGVKLLKVVSDPKVYAVAKNSVLRWVKTPEITESIYGADWADNLESLDVTLFRNYTIGEPIAQALP